MAAVGEAHDGDVVDAPPRAIVQPDDGADAGQVGGRLRPRQPLAFSQTNCTGLPTAPLHST